MCEKNKSGNSIQRTLELTIRVNDDDFEVDVFEPESGEVAQMQFPLSEMDHPEINKALGEEILSWVSLWKDELDA